MTAVKKILTLASSATDVTNMIATKRAAATKRGSEGQEPRLRIAQVATRAPQEWECRTTLTMTEAVPSTCPYWITAREPFQMGAVSHDPDDFFRPF